MLSSIFSGATATQYRRTANGNNVKTWTSQGTIKGKFTPTNKANTYDGQTGITDCIFYTDSSVLSGDKLVISSKNYIVRSVQFQSGFMSSYYICILATSDGD